jgi:hypothetical protein
VPLQLSDGFWGADLRNPSAYGYEESGTAFFTYAIAWGVNTGILDPAVYKPVLTKAWTALSTIALQPSGEVGYVQGATKGASQPSDGQPVKVTDTSAYGVGGFLLAGSEMVHILAPTNTARPATRYPRQMPRQLLIRCIRQNPERLLKREPRATAKNGAHPVRRLCASGRGTEARVPEKADAVHGL